MKDYQKTLLDSFTLEGRGLHTGERVQISIKPAPENHGYKFVRKDLENNPTIKADVDLVVETERGTTLEQNGARVYTTEHVLASLYGMGIDNALIELTGAEIPILDGSSKPFVDGIVRVGEQTQSIEKNYFYLLDNIKYENKEKKAEMLAIPDQEMRVTVMVDYNSPLLGTQHASMYDISQFKNEISGCRTFVFLREVEFLFKKGLIKGGDVDNAIVMVDQKVSAEKLDELRALFNMPTMDVQGIGMLNNVPLRYENEPARHKLLDIVGDFALIGQPIKCHVLAARPGHKSNVEFAKILKDHIKKEKKRAPRFNVHNVVKDVNEIKKLIPHRYPFLLVDKVIELTQNRVVGVKNITATESFFQGHFPDAPVMPGVLIIEAMAQTGGILALHQVSDPENYLTYFMKIDGVKFKQKVVPGDTLIMELELISPIRHGVVHMKATAYVNDYIVTEGELMAQIVKEKK
jgi:UDP-3-O-[3-hydroxymyristoyl] N-acetylglucosamine deacetylase/3-hydroxyacyl-[acyl-carrier-protein] dehydratase